MSGAWIFPPGRPLASLPPALPHSAAKCRAGSPHALICTRAAGHTGRHAAAAYGRIVAVWP